MKRIKLTQGKWTLVSDEDYEYLNQWRWCAGKSKKTFYAVRSSPHINGKQHTIRMHQIIAKRMGIKNPDHIDTDGLNNQRDNLREATESQQTANQNLQKDNKSGYKGVSWYKEDKKWVARIIVNKGLIYLGSFDSIKDAARAYNKAAIKCFGEFARINDMEHKSQTLSVALLSPEELAKHL
jgi:hypothetical protein